MEGVELVCEISNGNRPYIPKPLRQQIMQSLHCLDHIGWKPSTVRIASEFYWPSLKHDVKRFVQLCNTCKKVKAGSKLTNTGEFKVPGQRFSHVMVDVVGPLPPSYGYRYLLTAICRTTRLLHAMPLKEASASEVSSAFLHGWVAWLGVPSVVSSDNGGSFAANLWKDMMSKLHIDVKYSALYRPQHSVTLNVNKFLRGGKGWLGSTWQA